MNALPASKMSVRYNGVGIKADTYRDDRRWHVKVVLPDWIFNDMLADQDNGKALTILASIGQYSGVWPDGGVTYYQESRRFMGVAKIEEQTEKKTPDIERPIDNQVLEIRFRGYDDVAEYRAFLPSVGDVQLSESDYTQIIDIVTKAMQRANANEIR